MTSANLVCNAEARVRLPSAPRFIFNHLLPPAEISFVFAYFTLGIRALRLPRYSRLFGPLRLYAALLPHDKGAEPSWPR